MIMRRWKPSGAPSSARPSSKVPPGPRTGCGGKSLSTSKRFITGRGSTALWATNHLWTTKPQTNNNEKNQLRRVQEKGGRRPLDMEENEIDQAEGVLPFDGS